MVQASRVGSLPSGADVDMHVIPGFDRSIHPLTFTRDIKFEYDMLSVIQCQTIFYDVLYNILYDGKVIEKFNFFNIFQNDISGSKGKEI